MSSGPRPVGREYNPKNYLVGTQAFRVVNLAFAATCAVATVLGVLFIKYRGPGKGKLATWLQSASEERDYSVDVKVTQARLQALRVQRKLEEDPLYRESQERIRLGLAQPIAPNLSPNADSSSATEKAPIKTE